MNDDDPKSFFNFPETWYADSLCDLIFYYFQIAAEQTSYGFSMVDLPEIFPEFPENSRNQGNLRRANCSRGATCPAKRVATSLSSSSRKVPGVGTTLDTSKANDDDDDK